MNLTNYLNEASIFKPVNIKEMSTKEILERLGIKKYTINKDGLVDVVCDVNLSNLNLKEIPINFGKVKGHFYCSGNRLTSLNGAPQKVGGSFYCSRNQLTSLNGAPKEVGGYFGCARNQLTSLNGAPKKVGGSFYCDNNQLTSLNGAPNEVGGSFYCSRNQLTSLNGAPQKVGEDFVCYNNKVEFTEEDVKKVCNVKGNIYT